MAVKCGPAKRRSLRGSVFRGVVSQATTNVTSDSDPSRGGVTAASFVLAFTCRVQQEIRLAIALKYSTVWREAVCVVAYAFGRRMKNVVP